jgi:hypothetical protein
MATIEVLRRYRRAPAAAEPRPNRRDEPKKSLSAYADADVNPKSAFYGGLCYLRLTAAMGGRHRTEVPTGRHPVQFTIVFWGVVSG